MVLSTTKRTSSISSIVNRNQGGGSKKAGLPTRIGVNSWTYSAYRAGGVYGPLSNLQKNRFKLFPSQNLPVGFRSQIQMH